MMNEFEFKRAMTGKVSKKPVLHQTWSELLFLHWRLPVEEIQKTLPDGLTVDSYENSAWIGIVPFFMKNIRPRGLFPVPWLSYFQEINVRTYVRDRHGRTGVWFYSLDTDRWLAYKIGRIGFNLSYFHANMSYQRDSGQLEYRTFRKGVTNSSCYRYRATENASYATAEAGTLDYFLLERYRLFSLDRKSETLFTGEVEHRPYEFCAAELPEWDTQPALWDELPPLEGDPAHSCVAKTVHVDVFATETVQ